MFELMGSNIRADPRSRFQTAYSGVLNKEKATDQGREGDFVANNWRYYYSKKPATGEENVQTRGPKHHGHVHMADRLQEGGDK
jgi:hypothetical protein